MPRIFWRYLYISARRSCYLTNEELPLEPNWDLARPSSKPRRRKLASGRRTIPSERSSIIIYSRCFARVVDSWICGGSIWSPNHVKSLICLLQKYTRLASAVLPWACCPDLNVMRPRVCHVSKSYKEQGGRPHWLCKKAHVSAITWVVKYRSRWRKPF